SDHPFQQTNSSPSRTTDTASPLSWPFEPVAVAVAEAVAPDGDGAEAVSTQQELPGDRALAHEGDDAPARRTHDVLLKCLHHGRTEATTPPISSHTYLQQLVGQRWHVESVEQKAHGPARFFNQQAGALPFAEIGGQQTRRP